MAEPCSGRAREVPEDVEAGPLMARTHRSAVSMMSSAFESKADDLGDADLATDSLR